MCNDIDITYLKYKNYVSNFLTLKGNVNRYAVVTRRLSPVIVAQYIRLHPRTWHSYTALRIDFLGCLKGILTF